jgi:hypothetical protein
MNNEYWKKDVMINGKIVSYWQLEVVNSNVDLNKGFLGCIGYETIVDMQNRENGQHQIVAVKSLTASLSYPSVRMEALGLINADPRFAGAEMGQFEIPPPIVP